MPAQWLYETAARWDEELAAVQAVVEDRRHRRYGWSPSPDPAAADAAAHRPHRPRPARRCASPPLVANRLAARRTRADPWLAGLAAQQAQVPGHWHEEWAADAPVSTRSPTSAATPAAPTTWPRSPSTPPAAPGRAPRRPLEAGPVEDRLADDGVLVWVLPLPGANKSDLDLVRRGDELLAHRRARSAGSFRSPSALRRCTVSGAALRRRGPAGPLHAGPGAVAAHVLT